MNKNEADKLVRGCRYLTPGQRLVFLTLLGRVDYATCELPERFTPTLAELAGWTGLAEKSVKRSLAHLDAHGWVGREVGRGRGHKSRYELLPRTPDPQCGCRPVKGDKMTPFTEGRKGVIGGEKRGHSDPRKGDIGDRKAAGQQPVSLEGREGEGRVMPDTTMNTRTSEYVPSERPQCAFEGCAELARRACVTCFEHARLEFELRDEIAS